MLFLHGLVQLARGAGGFNHPVALVLLAGVGTASLAQLLATARALPGSPSRAEIPDPELMED